MKCSTAHSGFTLLEVMIALFILAALTLLTSQALRSAIDNKTFVSSELQRDARLADTLRIIRADIGQAFHYQDIFCKMDNEARATPTPAANPNNPVPPIQQQPLVQPPFPGAPGAGPTPKPCPPQVTGFIGEPEALYFTTLSNVRTIRDSQISDQAKVGYYVKSCQSRGAKSVPTKCLFRAISPILNDEFDKPGPETLLLEHVEEFKLRYLGPAKEDYVDTWKTDKNGDDSTKDKFPYAVEITLTAHDRSNPKDRPDTATVLAPIYFQNNPVKKKQNQGATPTPSPSPRPK